MTAVQLNDDDGLAECRPIAFTSRLGTKNHFMFP